MKNVILPPANIKAAFSISIASRNLEKDVAKPSYL